MSDIRFFLLVVLTTSLPFHWNWSVMIFAIIGIFIAFIWFWNFIKNNRIFAVLIVMFGVAVSIINYGQSSIVPEIIAVSFPTIILFIAQRKRPKLVR